MNALTIPAALSATKSIASFLAPVKYLIVAALPASVRSIYLSGKLDILEMETREQIFHEIAKSLSAALKDRNSKIEKAKAPASLARLDAEIHHIERRMRYLATLKESLGRLEGKEATNERPAEETSPTWFDLFRETAERPCEPWRRALIAEAAAVELACPGAISLKTLWNIAMLDTSTFEIFAVFLESAMYLDGYPVIIFDKENHASQILDIGTDKQTTLAILLGSLIEHGLVSYDHFQLESIEDIRGLTKSKQFSLRHNVQEHQGIIPFVQLTGHHCTDLGLDLARLCDMPRLRDLSDMSLAELRESLKEQTELEIVEEMTRDG